MSDKIKNSGAVPSTEVDSADSWIPGVSLRDFFAGQAMQAFIISEVIEAFRRNDYDGRQAHATYLPINNTIDMAEAAYIQANAMMLARWPKEPLE